jgi:FKBP-type peptidyl-prolyl cis-trans isomerase FkpA
MKGKILFRTFGVCVLFLLASCVKDSYDAEKQSKTDDRLIAEFVASQKINATKHSSGLYYQVLNPGSGAVVTAGSTVGVTYEGRLLNGNVFDSTKETISFPLSGVIPGWTIGMQLIKPGGQIRLILPSALAYGNQSPGAGIPKNSILDFTIDLKYAK